MYYLKSQIMTIVSEKQAYIMGCLVTEDGRSTVEMEFQEDLSWFQACEWKMLEGRRKIDFLRGVIDTAAKSDGHVVTLDMDVITDEQLDVVDAARKMVGNKWVWTDVNTIDLMGSLLYEDSEFYSQDNMDYLACISTQNPWGHVSSPGFIWDKGLDSAVPPTKNRPSDSGFDLTVVEKIKEKNGVHYYDTGIQVQPDNGFYFEIIGRSSISKTGWMLANNVGVIDASYRGNIIVALVRVVPEAPEIELPMRLVQLIPRQLILMQPKRGTLSNTTRGEKGFGSSGK